MMVMGNKEKFFEHIEKGYTTKGDFITMGAGMVDGETVNKAFIKIPLKSPYKFQCYHY